MGMNGTYYRAHIENMKLRKNKAKYKRLKESVMNLESNTVLKYNTPSPEELQKIRQQIFIDIRKSRRRNNLLLGICLIFGLIGLVLIFLLIEYVYF